MNLTINTSTNRVTGSGVTYGPARGNLTNDGSKAYTYDDLNRLTYSLAVLRL